MQTQNEYFKSVYDATYHDILRYVVIKSRSASDVEDIIQNAYMKFYNRIQKRGFSDIENPAAFIMSVVQSELKRYYRFRIKRDEREQELNGCVLPDGGASVDDIAINAELIHSVWASIEAAPPLSYKAFVLHYCFGMSVEDTARELGLSASAVTARLYRVRQSVRSDMKKEWEL